MPTDLTDLYQLESALDASIAAAFAAESIFAVTRANAPVDFQKQTPRVEIKCAIGAATGLKKIRGSDSSTMFAAWRVNIAVQTVVQTSNDGTNAAPMQFLGQVRKLMNSLAQTSWNDETNFPNLLLAEPLRDSGTQTQTKQSDGFEYATAGYSGIVMIRDATAW